LKGYRGKHLLKERGRGKGEKKTKGLIRKREEANNLNFIRVRRKNP